MNSPGRELNLRNKEKDAEQIARKKVRIIEEGFRLFAEKGINNVTIPQIAAASGVSRAAFFLYFPSNGVLFRIERPSVTSSVYSNSLPTEMPRAMMLTLTLLGASLRKI